MIDLSISEQMCNLEATVSQDNPQPIYTTSHIHYESINITVIGT